MTTKFKYIFPFLSVVILSGCCVWYTGLPYYTLKNSSIKMPSDSGVYANKSKFDLSILNIIDTAVVYESYGTRHGRSGEVENAGIERLDTLNYYYNLLRFYPNGYLNSF